MQTILGAGGAIGTELAKALPKFTDNIRLVSRNPKPVNEGDELLPADLTKSSEVDKAVAGSEIVYLVVGFEYNIKVWRAQWPALVRNVIDACKKHGCKLVFFDNIYVYDRNHLHQMTEETPVLATSKKGQVRAEITRMLMDEARDGNLSVLIARAADFIRPSNSVLVEMVFKNLKKGKNANWFVDVNKIHSFTYTPDAGKATAFLGNTPEAYNQVWHLPTANARLTGKEWIGLFSKAMDMKPKYTTLPAWLVGVLGIFVPIMKEFREMLYQYDRDYFFDSSKFEKKFAFKPTPPEEAVEELVKQLS